MSDSRFNKKYGMQRERGDAMRRGGRNEKEGNRGCSEKKCDSGTVGRGTVRQWDCETVGLWDSETVKQWDCGTMGLWDSGTVELWDYRSVGLWERGHEI